MEFTVTIDCSNDAFGETGDELARILRRLAKDVESGVLAGNLYDVNGNAVGTFELAV